MGVAILNALQAPVPVPGGHAEDRFMATRQVTRHYIAYHGGSGDTINGSKCATQPLLARPQAPVWWFVI